MTLVIQTFILCDGCGEPFGVQQSTYNGAQQRRDAREDGWVYSGNKDYCPECRAKTKTGKNHSKKQQEVKK